MIINLTGIHFLRNLNNIININFKVIENKLTFYKKNFQSKVIIIECFK